MVDHPHGGFRDTRREFGDLYAVELVDVDLRQIRYIQFSRELTKRIPLVIHELAYHLDLEKAKFPVRDDQEISAAACRVEEFHLSEPRPKTVQFRIAFFFVAARFQPIELLPKRVQKKRLDDFQYVRFGGVVRSHLPPFLTIHHGLEQGAKNGRRNPGPVETARSKKTIAHLGVERWKRQALPEQHPVHVRELPQILVQRDRTLAIGSVQRLEYHRQESAEIRPVLPRSLFEEFLEYPALLENARIVGEQAEHDPDEKAFQIMPVITRALQSIV